MGSTGPDNRQGTVPLPSAALTAALRRCYRMINSNLKVAVPLRSRDRGLAGGVYWCYGRGVGLPGEGMLSSMGRKTNAGRNFRFCVVFQGVNRIMQICNPAKAKVSAIAKQKSCKNENFCHI